jgi:hypothetical protein
MPRQRGPSKSAPTPSSASRNRRGRRPVHSHLLQVLNLDVPVSSRQHLAFAFEVVGPDYEFELVRDAKG